MTKRILVVDDNEDNRQILIDLLSGAGYEVIEAHTGFDAVTIADARGARPGADGHPAPGH